MRRPVLALLAATLVAALTACAQPGPPPGPSVASPSNASPAAASPAVAGPATPSGTPVAATTPAAPERLTMAFTGDMLWHDSLMKSIREDARRLGSATPEEYGPLFADVAPLVRDVDVAVCHTEVPFARPGTKPSGYPAFGAPASVARVYADLGFDFCTTASNHSLDRGFPTLVHTLDVLERDLGIVTAGTNRTAADAARPRLLTTAGGVRIAVVTGTYGSNGGFDKARPWALESLDGLVDRARAARAAGADIVVATMHAGQEYVTAPTSQQKALAKALAESGAVDLIVGHHAHTVQPVTRIGGTWVAYGIGNLVGQMRLNTPRAMEGLLVRATFARGADGRWRVETLAGVPLLVTYSKPGAPARIYPIVSSLERGVGPKAQLQKGLDYVRKATGQPAGFVLE